MKRITKNDLQPAERPGDGWYIIEAPGNYENVTTGGTRVVQELSAETLAAIAEAGVPARPLRESTASSCKGKGQPAANMVN